MYDVVGIGFGPSNLALAVCAGEEHPELSCLFLEVHDAVRWHPGMLLDGARMQISFLKDIVSLRNLASPYTFLQYTKARGRLERFVNLSEFRPTRVEYDDYLRWVAQDFADVVRYGTTATRVAVAEPAPADEVFRIETRDSTGAVDVVLARCVVLATGGSPRLPEGVAEGDRVIHSGGFLLRFPAGFPDRDAAHRFLVVGGGQSAGEIVEYLATRYERSEIHLVLPGFALRPTDNSPFTNEHFFGAGIDEFYELDDDSRSALADEVRNSNYGVVRHDLIDRLYDMAYCDEVGGRRRLFIHPCARLESVVEEPEGVVARLTSRFRGGSHALSCDAVLLATGYTRSLGCELVAPLAPRFVTDGSGRPALTRAHRVRLSPEMAGGLYAQGYGEGRFGLGETLLSHLPFRAKEILDDVAARLHGAGPARAASAPPAERRAYPKPVYVESDAEKLFALVERFRFATVVSVGANGEPLATHVPLVLDAAAGPSGVLYGHMDRANPHADVLDDHPVLVLFHGPNAYISPSIFDEPRLPTWNSMSVHIRGRTRLVEDPEALVHILCGIAERNDDSYRLSPVDPRISGLIDHIVGFEVEIEEMCGRFKLAQDQDPEERRRAALEMVRTTRTDQEGFIERMVGMDLTVDRDHDERGRRSLALGRQK